MIYGIHTHQSEPAYTVMIDQRSAGVYGMERLFAEGARAAAVTFRNGEIASIATSESVQVVYRIFRQIKRLDRRATILGAITATHSTVASILRRGGQ